MLRVIQVTKPEWVIAENVRGLVTWSEGMVLEQVCADLENEGYEVQPLIIPACAVNAPHRRDRVWIIANRRSKEPRGLSQQPRQADTEDRQSGRPATDTGCIRGESRKAATVRPEVQKPKRSHRFSDSWKRDWQEVAFATCDGSMDDGIPRIMDGVTISAARWRKESLKAYGNAIVPQVAMEIMRSMI